MYTIEGHVLVLIYVLFSPEDSMVLGMESLHIATVISHYVI